MYFMIKRRLLYLQQRNKSYSEPIMPIFTEHNEKLLMLLSLLVIVKDMFSFLRGAFTPLVNKMIPHLEKSFEILQNLNYFINLNAIVTQFSELSASF